MGMGMTQPWCGQEEGVSREEEEGNGGIATPQGAYKQAFQPDGYGLNCVITVSWCLIVIWYFQYLLLFKYLFNLCIIILSKSFS